VLVNIAQTQKITIFLTVASMNNFAKKMNLKKNFSNAIFFLFILYYYLPFLNEKKHYKTDLHLAVTVHKLST